MVIGIVGAGASGMAAALSAAENPEVQVILMERQARVGRKLQATGNGRCNLSNVHADRQGYHGEDPQFVRRALSERNPVRTLAWFRSLGLFTVTEAEGKVYPYSDQANSVVDILRLALQKSNITLMTGYDVQKIKQSDFGFTVTDGSNPVQCDKLIIACGGLAGSRLGGSMSGYRLLGKLGHKSTRLRPALVQIKSSWGGLLGLKGVRANACVQIIRNGSLFARSTGELQFTEFGISGPVVFEISRDVCYQAGNWEAELDFLPDISADDLRAELLRRRKTELSAEDLLTGVLHNRLGRVLTKAAGVTLNQRASCLSNQDIEEVCRGVKTFRLELTEPMGMDCAQVTAGGVITSQFSPDTMESKQIPGLYACGEVLDVDGDCGGYNLQWAWSSGYLAGKCAGKGKI